MNSPMFARVGFFVIAVSLCQGLLAAEPPGEGSSANDPRLFPFSMPTDAVTEGITNLSFLNDKPADELVSVRGQRFYAGGKPIRFWGFVIIGVNCFPEHAQAVVTAQRLAAMGLNHVRIHLIDGAYAANGLLDPAHKGELCMDAGQLDKLDFFVAELKKRGIYVELPIEGLHWRNITGPTEFPGMETAKFASFGGGMPLWNDKFIATEKQWARDFFGHVNPYTGKSYLQEPAVACVEIINENGVLCAWSRREIPKSWPPAMIADLQAHWNAFLKTRYQTTAKLRDAWAAGTSAANPQELLKNGDFSGGAASWGLQAAKPSTGATEVKVGQGPGGRSCIVITGDRQPQREAYLNLNQTGLHVAKGRAYRLTFQARAQTSAAAPVQLQMIVSMNHAPWRNVGLARGVEIGPQWQEFTLRFEGGDDEPDAKLMVIPPLGASQISLADISLRETGVTGLPQDQSLDNQSVTFPIRPEECVDRSPKMAADFVDFLYEVDQNYFATMRRYLKEELGCIHPIKGTQVDQYSSYFSQAQFDFLDAHGYWEHPRFPRKPWDPSDWTIGNSPLVNHGGVTVVELAGCRVRGKPYHISEYCHPAPSTYCAEEIPTIASLASLQDWDGITFHCWHELTYDWHKRQVVKLPPDKLDNYFNHARHPVKRVTIPFGTLAFRRGDVAPARQELAIGVTLDEEKRWMVNQSRRSDWWHYFRVAGTRGATWLDAFTHRLGLDLQSDQTPSFAPAELRQARSDTRELTYDREDPSASVITVNAPRAKAVIGFGAGKTFELGDVILKPGPTMQNGFSVITASAVRGENFHAAGAAILVTATGYIENQGMGWNAEKTTVGRQWGQGPALCEGIPFELRLKTGRARAWALDGRGKRLAPVPAHAAHDGVTFTFGPDFKTLWYEIAVD